MNRADRRRRPAAKPTPPLLAYLAKTLRENDDVAAHVEAGMVERAIADGYEPLVVRLGFRLWLETTPEPADDLPLTQTTQETT